VASVRRTTAKYQSPPPQRPYRETIRTGWKSQLRGPPGAPTTREPLTHPPMSFAPPPGRHRGQPPCRASPAVSVPAVAPRRPCWFPPVFLAPGAASCWCPSSLSPLLFAASPSPVAPLCRHSSLQRPSPLALLHADTLPAGSPSRWHPSGPASGPAGAPPCLRPSL